MTPKPTSWLDCPECGEDAIPSNADGLFHEDMPTVTCSCGARLRVVVSDDYFDEESPGCAYARLSDEED